MTNTEAGLLDDIIANPADDVPRLIYADWLEEHERHDGVTVAELPGMRRHRAPAPPPARPPA